MTTEGTKFFYAVETVSGVHQYVRFTTEAIRSYWVSEATKNPWMRHEGRTRTSVEGTNLQSVTWETLDGVSYAR